MMVFTFALIISVACAFVCGYSVGVGICIGRFAARKCHHFLHTHLTPHHK